MTIEIRLDALDTKVDQIGTAVTEIRTALVGIDGNNGLVSRTRKLETDMANIQRWRAYIAGLAVAVSTGIGFAIKYV